MTSIGIARTGPLRAVVVDADHRVRTSLAGLLGTDDGMRVVGDAADPETAVAVCVATEPDVVVMDLRLPDVGDGVALIPAIRDCCPGAAVVVLDWPSATGATTIGAGADLVVSRTMAADDLVVRISEAGRRRRDAFRRPRSGAGGVVDSGPSDAASRADPPVERAYPRRELGR
jgi:DNA-binding NarL/FixJ family response regulator